MKKYAIYIAVLAIGLLLGWFFFGNSSSETTHNHETSEIVNQQWTCSMHPQIMQPEAGDCPICGMDLIPAEAGADGLSANQFKMTENALALANIETSTVSDGMNSSDGLILSGKIQENEKTTAIQTAHFGGRIEKLHINSNGERVYKGQLLASIYSPELVTAQSELLTALSMKETQPGLYKAVKNKLKLWKLSEKQINTIESSKKIIENFPVYANVSGVVTMKMVEEGNYVKAGSPLLKIANLTTVWAHFDAYEKQLSSIQKGDEISITTNANPNKELKGKISFIDPILNTSTRTTIVRVVLNNKKGELKPGMFVQGFLKSNLSSTENSTLSIPKTAVLWTGKRSVVYVKQGAEPVFEMRAVKLGNVVGDNYEVLEGLSENEELVTNGTFTVDAAAQLQGKKSMMNTDGGKVMTGHENHIGMQDTDSSEEKVEVERIKVSSKFQDQLKTVFENYIELKDALVNDDVSTAQKTASHIASDLEKVDMKLLTDSKSHNLWMPLLKDLNSSSNEIAKSSDIKIQRAHFITLSNSITKSVAIYGVNKKVYKQFCPMANNDKGAFWLSTEENIRNPYFGEMMLKCGTVEAIIE